MFIESFVLDFDHQARTLDPSDLCTHGSGWKIEGEVCCDGHEWVSSFEADHPVFGRVCGSFESEIEADSEEAYENFLENHPPNLWDYWDI